MDLIDETPRDMPKRRRTTGRATLTSAAILALTLSLPAWTDSDEDALRLPDRVVTGQGGGTHSSYSKLRDRSKSVLNFRTKVRSRRPNIAAEFVGENVIPGAQIWAYPDGGGYPAPAITDAQAHDGKFSL